MRGTAWGLESEPADVMPWADRGLCRQLVFEGVPSDTWFPAEQGLEHPNVQKALRYCKQCEVRAECEEWAIEHYEQGVWGGTTDRMRKATRRRQQRASAKARAAG